MTRRMRFVGVTTGSSAIMDVFPRWAAVLGLDAELVGLDVPLGAPPQAHRAAMTALRDDPACAGALVTTHKIAVYEAAADLFEGLDAFASACGEVSSVRVRDGLLFGAAKDPLTAGLSLAEVLADGHFAPAGAPAPHVVCLGAGGAGAAIAWYLAQRADRPARMTFVDVDAARLDHLRSVVAAVAPETDLRTALAGDTDVAALLAASPPGSLVVNATGMGKDRPGTPVPDGAAFPRGAVVWELNYRGPLDFLHQARAQEAERGLVVVDGWRYFVHGWSQVVADVFDLDLTPALVEELAAAAASARPGG